MSHIIHHLTVVDENSTVSVFFLYLSNDVGLHVSIIVLACPHKTAGTLDALCHHVVDQSVLIPYLRIFEFLLVITVEKRDDL